MESTKVVSLRIAYDKYEKMILECDAKGITVSEFIERKIAAAGAVKEFKKEIAEKIESAMNSLERSTTHAKIKLRSILEFIGKFS
jgi:hypothetical protein